MASSFVVSRERNEAAQTLWHQVLEEVSKMPQAASLLDTMAVCFGLDVMENGKLIVGIPDHVSSTLTAMMQGEEVLRNVTVIYSQFGTGRDKVVQFEVVGNDLSESVQKPKRRQFGVSTEVWKQIEKMPFVQQICEQFSGRVVDVRTAQ